MNSTRKPSFLRSSTCVPHLFKPPKRPRAAEWRAAKFVPWCSSVLLDERRNVRSVKYRVDGIEGLTDAVRSGVAPHEKGLEHLRKKGRCRQKLKRGRQDSGPEKAAAASTCPSSVPLGVIDQRSST
eukprot:scaffold30_cov255-Pinguiococcus_pyrenoidosus.AAC.14